MIDAVQAPGWPGIGPTWAGSAKDAVGCSLFASRVWFTIGHGILNEVYWPRVDRPQIRDLGFIVADGAGFWSEVKRDAERTVRAAEPGVPAITVTHRHTRYELIQRICVDDRSDVLRIEVRLVDRDDAPGTSDHDAASAKPPLRLYALVAPHVGFSGLHNRAWAGSYKGRRLLFAQNGDNVLALGADPAPDRMSVGYVGASDGWQDFARHGRMTWTYEATDEGNVAGLVELTLDRGIGQVAVGFGGRPEEAALQVGAALATEFDKTWREYIGQWREFVTGLAPSPAGASPEDLELYLTSAAVLRSHADRSSPGAIVASLSIPWGNSRNDIGGYHLVWSRDLVESAGALVALGATVSARRTLAYLVASQEPDGSWPQNQWVDGVAYWNGRQLDEAAYPILLVGALRQHGAAHMHGLTDDAAESFEHLLTEESLDRMVEAAAGFIARTGPATGQDRWEENPGLAPSTLAPVVAALVVAAHHLPATKAAYALELADDWNASIEDWTYASGSRLARDHGVEGHYVRIAASDVLAGAPISTPVPVRNREAEASMVPADEMVGTDFLAMVRFGLRLPDDPRILSTLAVSDALLRAETPSGPVWRRYSGDGYGEHDDGTAFDGTGVGRGWPLLVGERGHYELQAGRDARPFLGAMRAMTSIGGMLPEQVWDAAPIRERGLAPGRPSGSAMPLAWAHAEYIKLVRSIELGHPIDRPDAAWNRYRGNRPTATRGTWRFAAQRPTMLAGRTLRLELLAPARVRFTTNDWSSQADLETNETGLGVWIADIPRSELLPAGGAVEFTFWWLDAQSWEGANFRVAIVGP